MSSAGPWSVKGIDPKAREIAKDLARRSGQTLGEWLNQMIIEGEGEGEPSPPGRAAAAPQALAVPALAAAGGSSADLKRVTHALDELSNRMEAAEQRSGQAIAGIDRRVSGVLSRLDGAEGATGKLEGVRDAQAKLAERLGRMDEQDAPRRDALKALESALGKVAAQIYEGESRARTLHAETRGDLAGLQTRVDRLDARQADPDRVEARFAEMAERLAAAEARTGEAVRALEFSFAGLDRRLLQAEAQASSEVAVAPARFEQLAAELSDRVETARAEMAERIRSAASGKLDALEGALRDLAGDVSRAEKRSAQAIDTMGREVVRIAQSLSGRLQSAEGRQEESDRRTGGEVQRIADVVEARLRRGDDAQAEALERLGGEIARIAEKLADRIGASERRAAQASDELGRQIGLVTDKLNAGSEAAAAEFAERVRTSEERTARLLAEPRPEPPAPPAAAPQAAAEPAPPPARPPVAAPSSGRASSPMAAVFQPAPPPARPADPFGDFDAEEDEPFASDFGVAAEAPSFAADPFSDPIFAQAAPPEARAEPAAQPLAWGDPAEGWPEEAEPSAFGQPLHPAGEATAPRVASTRELIESARAAARQAAEARGGGRRARDGAEGAPASGLERLRGVALPDMPWKRRGETGGSTLRTAALASVVASSTVAIAVGAFMLAKGDGSGPATTGEAPTAVARGAHSGGDQLAVAMSAPDAPGQDPGVDGADPHGAATPADAPAAAGASPGLKRDTAPVPQAPDAPANARTLYASAVRQIEAGDAAGPAALRRAANLGYAPAQFYLAKLYEDGRGGVSKDLPEARRWTERAAVQGDGPAMFNLGLFFAQGDGGPKNDASAVAWFKRAADLGVHDAQYNLAVMTQNGRGAARNPADAYKWYLIAASQGDAGARAGADALKLQLSPDQLSTAERAAAAYRTQIAATQVRAAAAQ